MSRLVSSFLSGTGSRDKEASGSGTPAASTNAPAPAAQTSANAAPPAAPTMSLDDVINAITTTPNHAQLSNILKNGISKDVRDTIFASTLASGEDPLSVLDIHENTLGILYILAARMTIAGSAPLDWQYIDSFCNNFDVSQAFHAPDRLTVFARGILQLATGHQNTAAAISPLSTILKKFAPPHALTTLHPLLVSACLSTRHYAAALPWLVIPITTTPTHLSPLHYTDNLTYHYAGGMIFGALKRWREAEEFFETVITAPASNPVIASAVQVEAAKKLVLVQLISKGKPSPLPKYTSQTVTRYLRSSAYNAFVDAYPLQTGVLRTTVEKDRELFETEQNMGLLQQALQRAPRWHIKQLTSTYVTLSLADIAQRVDLGSEDEVQAIVLDMIEANEITAKLSTDGTVTFSDPPSNVTKAEIDRILAHANAQSKQLRQLDLELEKNRDFLSKATSGNKDEPGGWQASGGGPSVYDDETIIPNSQGSQFAEDTLFP